MSYSINTFKEVMSRRGGLARSNIYRVTLPPIEGASSADLNVLCKNVQLPGRQVMTNERRIGIATQKVAYGYAVVEVPMTFIETNNYDIRKYFEAWQNIAVNQETKELGWLRGLSGYGKDVYIEQLKKGSPASTVGEVSAEDVIYKCRLTEAYPTTINSVDLSNESETLVEINVSFSYTNWMEVR